MRTGPAYGSSYADDEDRTWSEDKLNEEIREDIEAFIASPSGKLVLLTAFVPVIVVVIAAVAALPIGSLSQRLRQKKS